MFAIISGVHGQQQGRGISTGGDVASPSEAAGDPGPMIEQQQERGISPGGDLASTGAADPGAFVGQEQENCVRLHG